MQKSETAKVLAFVHSVQGGEVTEIEVEAWHELIGHLDYGAAMGTTRRHFERETRRLWPADLLRPAFDPAAHGAWLREHHSSPSEWAELCGWHGEREARRMLESRVAA